MKTNPLSEILDFTVAQLFKRRAISAIVLPVSAFSLLLLPLHAHADSYAYSELDFPYPNYGGIAIVPWSGQGQGVIANAPGSVSAQAGGVIQSASGATPSASASDGFTQASVSSSGTLHASLSSSSSLPNSTSLSSDQGRATVMWQTTFTLMPLGNTPNGEETRADISFAVNQLLTVSTDARGLAIADFNLVGTISGGQYTGPDQFFSLQRQLSIGPNTTESFTPLSGENFGEGAPEVEYGVTYDITFEADVDTYVRNVPDSGSTATLLGIAIIGLIPLASKFRRAAARAAGQ